MNKQDEFEELMKIINHHYSSEQINEFKSYAIMEEQKTDLRLSIDNKTYGN